MSEGDPYTYPGSLVLRNKLDIVDAAYLDYVERELVTQRATEGIPTGRFDLQRPRVLIAHGWLGHAGQFRVFVRRLAEAGFDTAILSYPSMFGSFEQAVELARRAVASSSTAPLHLVGFSLGGLVMRALAAERPAGLASLLLIGTPNAGSPIADLVGRITPTPALRRLSTTAPALPAVTGIPVGCIVGSRPGPLGFLFGEENDGRVAVSSALAISHHDARTIAVGHRALPSSAETARLAVGFLRDGRF